MNFGRKSISAPNGAESPNGREDQTLLEAQWEHHPNNDMMPSPQPGSPKQPAIYYPRAQQEVCLKR